MKPSQPGTPPLAPAGAGTIRLVSASDAERALPYVGQAIESGPLGAGGRFSLECERSLARTLSARRVVLTSSGTSALHLAGQALHLDSGSEIIVPSFAFASCASVFVSLGASVAFADCAPDSPNIDAEHAASLIGPRTRAILALHYGGIACDMDALVAICRRAGIALIEDAAHALFGSYRGTPLGTLGTFGTFSFDYAKNVTCGEGGALAVNDVDRFEAVEVACQRGTNRASLLRGEAATYEWLGAGGNYSASELQAAFLLAQLDAAERIQARRQAVWEAYTTGLRDWSAREGVALPDVPPGIVPGYHVYYLRFPTTARRAAAIGHLAARGVESAFHYLPLHLSPGGRARGGMSGSCPNAETIAATLLRIPLHANLDTGHVERVIAALTAFRA